MGALVNVGLGEMSLEQINESLTEGYEGQKVNFVAPAAGLILANMKLNY
jgi:tRNA U38,U39,U40 pseudouridine synthase TruA